MTIKDKMNPSVPRKSIRIDSAARPITGISEYPSTEQVRQKSSPCECSKLLTAYILKQPNTENP